MMCKYVVIVSGKEVYQTAICNETVAFNRARAVKGAFLRFGIPWNEIEMKKVRVGA